MRASNFPLLLILCSTLGGAAPAPTASDVPAGCALQLHIDGLRNSTGVVGAAIFQSAAGWPEDQNKALHVWPTAIVPGSRDATAEWANLQPGDYGVVVIHDENKNHKLDRNMIGIPKEGFGFANNPHISFTAPPYASAVVHVACPVTETTIHMIYK